MYVSLKDITYTKYQITHIKGVQLATTKILF